MSGNKVPGDKAFSIYALPLLTCRPFQKKEEFHVGISNRVFPEPEG